MTKLSKRESKRQLTLRKLEALAQSTTHAPEAETARSKAQELKITTSSCKLGRPPSVKDIALLFRHPARLQSGIWLSWGRY
jgi:hypothetical protein